MLNRAITLLFLVFLLSNIILRLYALHSYGIVLKQLLPVLLVVFWVVRGNPGFISICFFLFGISLPLYGFQSYNFYNHIFEFQIIFLSCLLLFTKGTKHGLVQEIGVVGAIASGYLLLIIFSLLLLPVSSFIDNVILWGPFDVCSALFYATPENPLYSLAAVNRFAVFGVFILLLNNKLTADKLYGAFFSGCAVSVLATCLLGLLNQFNVISLEWYRPEFISISGVNKLHSVLGNPGWFSEHVLVCTPFVLLLFYKKINVITRQFVFVTVFILIGMSLLLTGSRTGWLIFPIVVFFCCVSFLLFYVKKDDVISWKELKLRFLQVSSLGIVVCLMIGSILMVVALGRFAGNIGEASSREQYLVQRMRNIINPSVRIKLWKESLVLVSESPVFGMGYEGYRWHQEVMTSVPASKYAQQRQTRNNWDTTHNFYLQILVSNGVAGLLIWFMLISYVALLLYRDAITNRNEQSFVLLGALGAFHLYGFTQSMQYVASIWFLVFIIIGYSMNLESKIKLPGIERIGKYMVIVVILFTVSGGVVYGRNLQSHKLAERYGLSRYGVDRNDTQYKGFYKKENWGKDGMFRWSGRAAEIVLNGSGKVQFDFACYAPRLEQLPITLDVVLNDQSIDRITFRKGQKVTRTYDLPVRDNHSPVTLYLNVSRVWNPKREKINTDTRNLGIAVSEARYISILPTIPVLLLQ